MAHKLLFLIWFIQFAGIACQKKAEDTESSESGDRNVSEAHTIQGKLAIEENPTLVAQKIVHLRESDGTVVTSTYSDTEGNYTLSVPNTLVLASGTSLQSSDQYSVTSVIEDDGDGNVLGIKKNISLITSEFSQGILNLGTEKYSEISAVKGIVKFINPDGTENSVINKVGTDVYFPGYSLFARTDKDGAFLILYIPPDTYTLRIEKGLIEKELTADVKPDTTLNLGEIKIITDTEKPITTASLSSVDFKNPTCVSLSANEESKIYYTLDGGNPQANESFLYNSENVSCGSDSCPICIKNQTTRLKYFAVDTAGNQENLRTQVYFYNEEWADPADTTKPVTTLSVNGSVLSSESITLTGPGSLVLKASEGANIYYTLDGSAPTTASDIFDYALDIKTTTTVKYYAVDWAGNTESVLTKTINVLNWKKISYSGSPTAASYKQNTGHGMVYDAERSQILFYCNNCGAGSSDDTWSYSGGTWTKVNNQTVTSALNAMVYNSVNKTTYMIIHPDRTTSAAFVVYSYNPATSSWSTVSVSGIANPPSTMWESSASFDSASNAIIYKYSTLSNGILSYSFNASTGVFTQLTTTSAEFSRLAYDANRGKTIGFGQISDAYNNYIGAVFELSSGAWSPVTTNFVPPGDNFVYDSVRKLIVSFGAGSKERETASNPTWSYNGTDWSLASPQSAPKPRNSPFLVYDSNADKVILYGGHDRFDQSLSDMWEYTK